MTRLASKHKIMNMDELDEITGLEDDNKKSSPSPFLIPGAIIIAGILIAGAIFYTSYYKISPNSQSGSMAASVGDKGASGISAVGKDLADDDPFLGSPEAPVVLVEFGDFQCPFCARFFQTTEREIIEKYIKTGKARLVYRDFPLIAIHKEAQKAAEAAECANEQGKFWMYHDMLYQRQSELSLQNYKKWAADLGLNSKQFNQCLDSDKYAAEVAKDLADGQAAGVGGTPTTFVNGRVVQGAVPFAQFKSIIEEELKKVR